MFGNLYNFDYQEITEWISDRNFKSSAIEKIALVWLIKLSIYSLENFRYFNSKSFQ